jgi:tetratricopeptide (TPR) repeat protein
MKPRNNLLLFFLVIQFLFTDCSSKKIRDNQTENLESDTTIQEKVQIKAFWESYRKAQKFRVAGNWTEAALAYEQALKINPEHEDSWFNLGNMYLELNQGEKAVECWQNIVSRNPNSARAHMQLGRLYLSYERPETFDLEKAKYEFETAANINKVITGPLMQLGYVALIKKEDALAYDYFQAVTNTDSKSAEPHFLLGYLAWKNSDIIKMQDHVTKAYALASPDKSVKTDLSEGDTKDGKSHLRPINQSIYYEYYINLGEIQEEDLNRVIPNRYQKLDSNLVAIRKLIGA